MTHRDDLIDAYQEIELALRYGPDPFEEHVYQQLQSGSTATALACRG